jgi:F0F1-type ATP synthase assembly protein I
MITIFLKSIGLISIKQEVPCAYNHNDYDLKEKSDSEKIVLHKEFLKSILEEENNRLGFIENKTSQIISQTSIVFSLLGLFVPIIMDRFENTALFFKILIIVLLLITFSFYLLSITNALKNFDIKNFKYPSANPINVLDFKMNSVEQFNAELVRDYLYSIDKAVKINNKKGTNLLHAHKAFKIGNFLTGMLVIVVCSILLFTKKEESSVMIKQPVEIKNLDFLLKKNRPIIIIRNDSMKNKMVKK